MTSQTSPTTRDSFNHQCPHLAARITIDMPHDTASGTGFFLQVSRFDDNGVVVYQRMLLISNRHVLNKGNDGRIRIRHNRMGADGNVVLGSVHIVSIDRFEQRYVPHPNEQVDLACLDVTDLYGLGSSAYIRYLTESDLSPLAVADVGPGSSVLFIGYPNDYFDAVNNLPLVRQGTLASLPNVDFGGKGVLIIDALVFQGSSGGPVFVNVAGNYYLLGVIEGTIQGTTPSGHPAVLGLGVVIKRQHVRELIEIIINSHG